MSNECNSSWIEITIDRVIDITRRGVLLECGDVELWVSLFHIHREDREELHKGQVNHVVKITSSFYNKHWV